MVLGLGPFARPVCGSGRRLIAARIAEDMSRQRRRWRLATGALLGPAIRARGRFATSPLVALPPPPPCASVFVVTVIVVIALLQSARSLISGGNQRGTFLLVMLAQLVALVVKQLLRAARANAYLVPCVFAEGGKWRTQEQKKS